MKTSRFSRRSLSPFGAKPVEKDFFDLLKDEISSRCPDLVPQGSSKLELFQDIGELPSQLRKVAQAPANDCPELARLCDYLTGHNLEISSAGLFDPIFNALKVVFDRKTEIFLVDHYDGDHCRKMGWKEDYRDAVLFSEERNILVGRFFEPMTKDRPGHFSEFIKTWSETGNSDRLLHFLDFCGKLANSSFEFFLLGSHPALSRIIRKKDTMRALLQKCAPLFGKIKSPTWEKDLRKTLSV